MINVFPHSLIRIAGSPYEGIEDLQYVETLAGLNKLAELNRSLNRIKEQVSQELYHLISQTANPQVQNQLLSLKRAVYNDRKVNPETIHMMKAIINESRLSLVISYLDQRDKRNELIHHLNSIYTKEQHIAREKMGHLASAEYFNAALVMSSTSLASQVRNYTKSSNGSGKVNSQTELGLLKYITRQICKTSPFSFFTSISTIRAEENVTSRIVTGDFTPSSNVRLNNHLFRNLIDLLYSYRPVYKKFVIQVNPTLHEVQGAYKFLVNINNVESFQTIERSPVLNLVVGTVANSEVSFEMATNALLDQIDEEKEVLEDYLYRLISIGLFEFDIGISGLDPFWNKHLHAVLRNHEASDLPAFKKLIDSLEYLTSACFTFENAKAEGRLAIMKESHHSLSTAFQEIKKEISNLDISAASPEDGKQVFRIHRRTDLVLRAEQIFYEDTIIKSESTIDKNSLESLVRLFNHSLQLFKFSTEAGAEAEKLKSFFLFNYSENESVGILKFYEDYVRRIYGMDEQQGVKDRARSGYTRWLEAKHELKERWVKEFVDWSSNSSIKNDIDAGSVTIAIQDIESINNKLGIVSLQTKTSYGAFIQPYLSSNGELCCVSNSVFSGFGKMASRFLHLFDRKITAELQNWNKDLAPPKSVFAEPADGTFFTANIHPPLLHTEVLIPGGNKNPDAESRIPISDLIVRFDKSADEIQLIDKRNGVRVYFCDLGFQSPKERSKLYNLLCGFTPIEFLSTGLLVNTINHQSSLFVRNSSVKILPRISIEGRITIQRKTWLIPKDLAPVFLPTQSEFDHFQVADTWRKVHGLPDEVFIHLNDEKSLSNLSDDQLKRLGRDDYKPQYYNFTKPIFLPILKRLLEKAPSTIKLQEMKPDSSELLSFAGKKRVTELLVQWYNHD